MIVLDESLSEARLAIAIRRWYPGRVCLVTELRPRTVVKDDAIPTLLLTTREPTFITTNVAHFWRKAMAHAKYSILCIDVPANIQRIAVLIRAFFRLGGFNTRAMRMGKVVRITTTRIGYYTAGDKRMYSFAWIPG